MCNIAGYVGSRRAAPILLEMLRRQEGFAGGYYTGIATIHEGRIYSAKLTGDVSKLISDTDAADLPGTIGIIHSRSKSGGGDPWAHPFLGYRNDVPAVAYVANGTGGFFKEKNREAAAIAEALLKEGYRFDSRVSGQTEKYQSLSDGTMVHMSDTMCQLILRNMDRGDDADLAMANGFCEMPAEIVGLLLSLDAPDRINWSRINYPMSVAFASHGAYLASAPYAIPDDAREPHLLPANSYGCVFADRFEAKPFENPPATVAPMDSRLRADAYAAVVNALKDGAKCISELNKQIAPLFEAANCAPTGATCYDVLYSLHRQGRLAVEIRTVEGVFDGMTAPKSYFSLK
ncbi:MAG: hypothetical protein IIW31_07355 [Clostridia bacterium]|nr:hypothetical protein [Clostridia bacterium]